MAAENMHFVLSEQMPSKYNKQVWLQTVLEAVHMLSNHGIYMQTANQLITITAAYSQVATDQVAQFHQLAQACASLSVNVHLQLEQ